MDTTSARCLVNSISRFILLVSCQTMKLVHIQKDYKNMVGVLKLLKPVLDEVVDCKIPSDEILNKECEEMDMAVNEARDFMENWSPKMSKISGVLLSEAMFMKIQSTSLEICQILYILLQSSPPSSSISGIQHCMQQIRCLKQERITEHIAEALGGQQDDIIPSTDHLREVVESLGLTSNQELLKESLAVEKEKMNAQVNQNKGQLAQTNRIVDLISRIRDYMLKIELYEETSGVPIPSYFLCPLSLELMSDPVIVASGQTYERAFIQKWLDQGMTVCPKTRQTLTHANLIPNYTVKAMIANWCERNNIRLSGYSEDTNPGSFLSPLDHVSAQDLIRTDSFVGSIHSSNSTSRSSLDVGNGFETLKIDVSSRLNREESNGCLSRDAEKLNRTSPEQSYIHSRSESASSAISSIDMPPTSNELSRRTTKHEKLSELTGEAISECPAASLSKEELGFSPWLSGKQFHGSKTELNVAGSGTHNNRKIPSLPLSDSGFDELTTTPYVQKLVEDLKSQSKEVQTAAAGELRFLAKHNIENRIIIGHCGAIPPLLSLLYSDAHVTQEHAVTALLNLSINEENKAMIAENGAIEPLIFVLKSGSDGAKENSAAALFSLSVLEEYKAKIGRSGAVKALVDLLGSGTLRGKKDAATALFNLSIFHENKARIVQAGAVKHLVDLMDPNNGMVDKAVALLANLSTIEEGRVAIAREGGIPSLVEVVESGSQRGKENAASVLLQLCLHSIKFCNLVLQEGAVPPLVALSQSGTPRAKEKAQQLLSHFRNQREGAVGKK